MHPDANLQEQRELANRLLTPAGADLSTEEREHASARLAELVLALDGWLGRGGFPPAAWAKWAYDA